MPGNRRADRRRPQTNNVPQKLFTEAHKERTDARAERTAVFGKTKMCKFFILGACAKGTDCAFAHDACEMQTMPDLSRTKICKTLINTGFCNDPECTYAHNKDELRHVPGVPTQLPRELGGPLGGSQRPPGAGDGHKAQNANIANAATAGNMFNPLVGMPGMPPMAGQHLDPQQQALALQQWMAAAQMMAQMQMMAAVQNQDSQARAGASDGYAGAQSQPQGASAGQSSFLYNALFSGAEPDAQGNRGLQHIGASASSAGSKKIRNANRTKATEEICIGCGLEFAPLTKFCRSCGAPRSSAQAQEPVAYQIKNTFIDVEGPAGGSPLGGMRSVKSAAGRLYAYGGDSTPQQQSPKDDDSGSPPPLSNSLLIPPFPLTSVDGSFPSDLRTSPMQMGAGPTSGDDSPGLNLPPMLRGNTWASDLCALNEEAGEEDDQDLDGFDNVHGAESSSGLPSSEKRLQDTPFARGAALSMSSEDEISEGRGAAYSFDSSTGRDREGSDMSAMDNVVIKNTFLEYKNKPSLGGLRQVQTASGRLDLMSQE